MREIRDLRNIMFKWGRQNMKDIDEIKKTTPRKKRNEELSEQVNQERFEERNNEIKQEKAELKNE